MKDKKLIETPNNENNLEILDSKILKLISNVPEYEHSVKMFGRQNSQYTSMLMSMTMLGDGPYHFMKQCMSQIQKKKEALKGIYFSMKKSAYKIKQWEKKGDEYSLILAEEAKVNLLESEDSITHSLREIKMFQEAYEEIREHHGINENWDEADFNKLEEENHVRMAFRLAVRKIMEAGRFDRSTCEYMESLGIHPMTGERLARQYHHDAGRLIDAGQEPPVKHFHDFLDSMVEKFKGAHKNTMERVGIKTMIREKATLLTHDHEDLDYYLEQHGFHNSELMLRNEEQQKQIKE